LNRIVASVLLFSRGWHAGASSRRDQNILFLLSIRAAARLQLSDAQQQVRFGLAFHAALAQAL
jgi:hypothetical protein